MKINIHATVSANSLGYYRYMQRNYRALASGENAVQFFVYCLDRGSANKLKGAADIEKLFALPWGRGSGGHAQAIETALSTMPKGDLNIIADTDAVLLMREWDRRLVQEMVVQKRWGIVGTRLEDIGGFSTGETKYQQYKKKPSTTWMALSPDYDFSALQVRPDKKNFIEVKDQHTSEIYNLPVGYFVVKDTGWQIPSYLDERKIPYMAFDIVKPTAPEAKALRDTNPCHDEFQWDGVPFLAHQRGSMTHRFRIDPLSVDFYDACDRYLGNPDWSVHPDLADRGLAQMQNVARAGKRVLRPLVRALRGS